jgi:signal transduction histidine kinase
MRDTRTSRDHASWLKRYIWSLAAAWTVVVAGLLAWEVYTVRQVTWDSAINEARAHFDKDQAFRLWVTSHGGVYVPTDDRTPPNPYLAHIPERDIETPAGRSLTLMNPAYALRQLLEDFADLYGIAGHITSLKPLRPANAPDDWERAALEVFDEGETEVHEFTEIDGVPYLRLMQPMIAQEGCLKCHGHQGYQVGDVRGGISVSVPMASYLTKEQQTLTTDILSFSLLWVLGLVGVGLGSRGLRQSVRERDQAQEALKAYSGQLVEMVEERTRELEEAQEELVRKEKLAVLGRLTARIAHELRHPLGVISNSVFYFRSVMPEAGEEIQEYLGIMSAESDRAEGIISALLDYTHTRPAQPERVAVPDLLSQALVIQPPPENVQVATHIAPGLPHPFVDPEQMSKALSGLLDNAYQAMPQGGELTINAHGEADTLVFSISDTGSGISPENMARLFEPLFTTSARSIGLGLAISRNLVEANEGSIEVDSQEGTGTTFTVRLPRREEVS